MASARPAIHVVEKNPYDPRPYVFSEVAVCLRDAIRAAGYPSEVLRNRIDPHAYAVVLGLWPDKAAELEHLDPARCAIFNFEQLGSTSGIAGPEYRRWLADWLVLVQVRIAAWTIWGQHVVDRRVLGRPRGRTRASTACAATRTCGGARCIGWPTGSAVSPTTGVVTPAARWVTRLRRPLHVRCCAT